ncbi:MAG: hypothetical protein ACPHL6_13990, partial [Rubripirellula sp.]
GGWLVDAFAAPLSVYFGRVGAVGSDFPLSNYRDDLHSFDNFAWNKSPTNMGDEGDLPNRNFTVFNTISCR